MPRLSKTRKEMLTTLMKDSIYEATTSVLSTHGVDGTTMTRVAEAADLAKSSLYDYFQNKDELMAFVAERIMAPTAQRIEEIGQADLSATEKLRGIVHAALTNVEQHRALLVLFVQDKFRHRPDAAGQPIRARVAEVLTRVFAQGVREGQLREIDPLLLSRLFMACLSEFCELWIAADAPEAVDRCVERLMTMLLHGVAIEAAPAGGGSTA